MRVESILVPKLEVGFFDFDPADMGLPKTTVKALKALCKSNGLTQTGLKADLIAKLQAEGLFPTLEGKHEPGPRWFYFDEAFGAGEHTLQYLCMCGAPMSLDLTYKESYSQKTVRQFYVKPTGAIYPSIECGNKACRYHIWAKLKQYDGDNERHKSSAYYYDSGHRNYNHERDKFNSYLHYKRRR